MIAEWSMILLVGLLPVFFVPLPWVTLAQAKVSLVATLLAVATVTWAIARFREGNVRMPGALVLAAGLLLPLAYAVSAVVSGVEQVSLVGVGIEPDTLAFACIFFITLALSSLIFSHTPRAGILAVRALYVGALALLSLEVVHFAMPTISLGGVIAGQTGNALGNWHDFAITLGFFVVLGLLLRGGEAMSGVWRYVSHVVVFASLLFLIIANFFDVWAAVAAAGVVALCVELMASRVRAGRLIFSWGTHGVWLATVVLALVAMLFGTYINNALPSRIRVASVEVRPSWQGTFAIGQQALKQPTTLFFGAGPNTFGHEWGLYKPVTVNQTAFWNTDFNAGVGSIPTSFVTTGILGILAWLLLVCSLLWIAGRALVRHARGAPDMRLAVAFGLATLYLIAFDILYVPGPAISVLVFVSAGLLVASAAQSRGVARSFGLRNDGWQSGAYLCALVTFGITALAALVGISRILLSEMLLNRSIAAYNSSQNVQEASALIRNAFLVYPSNARAHRAGVELGLLELQQLVAKGDPKDDAARAQLQATLQETIQHGLSAVAINGGDYQNWLQLAGLYQQLAGVKVAGAYENARAAYERARAENPSSPLPLFRLAQLELLENHTDAALADLTAAVRLKPDFAAAYYMASQIYASQNNLKDALAAAALAAKNASDDPLAWYNAGSIAYVAEDYANAVVALEKALALQPSYANAQYVLGLSYAALGRNDDSLKAFEALNTLDPNQSIVLEALAKLRAGKSPIPPAPPTRN